ncbi:MAG: hypothetical protein LBH69_02880 [Methanomassiliicoccaceae archaeon]|nr:hypothetical protein [Methanomassiliicoccaceae archaeon]
MLTFIPFVIIIAALPFLPDTIPQEIVIDRQDGLETRGEVSKYMLLAFPTIFTTTGLVMIWATRYLARRSEDKGEKGGMRMFYLSLATKVFLILLTLWIVIYVSSYVAGL